MDKRLASLLVLVVLVSLISFGSQSQTSQNHSATGRTSRSALAKWSARMKTPGNPPVSKVGFAAAPQIPGGGFTFRTATVNFPAVTGNFSGNGNGDVAEVIETSASGGDYFLSTSLGNGDGTFKPAVIQDTGRVAANPMADPIWVGDVDGDGKDDIVMGHQVTPAPPLPGAAAAFEVFTSNGDGTFTSHRLITLTFSTHITWGTLYKDPNNSNKLDVVIVDGTNSVVWTALGNGDGTFQTPTPSTAFSPAISPDGAVAFADYDHDGKLDFAAPSFPKNQVNVYINQGGGVYATGVPLTTSDGVYATCFDTAGDLNGFPDIVSANGVCGAETLLPNNVTVYVNNGDGTFQQGKYYSVGVAPGAVSVADANGDGKNDVIVANAYSGDVRVLAGNGDGTVQAASPGFAVGGSPHTQALVADFNHDGKPDMVLADSQFSIVYLEGLGDGNFRSGINYYANSKDGGFQPKGIDITSGDFNGDGIPDFVIGNANSTVGVTANGIAVFLSNPDGTLQPGVFYSPNSPTTFEFQHVAVADFNGDGKLDIAAADSVNGRVVIFYGKGDGTFTVGPAYKTDIASNNSGAFGLVAADFNGDGKADLAVVNTYSSGTKADVGILINNGSGFNTVVNYPLSAPGTKITVADLGNKNLDLVIPLYGTGTTAGTAVAVLLGKGDGTFQSATDVALGFKNPLYAAVGDVNGDGIPDLAVTIDDVTNTNQGIAVALGKGNGTFGTPTLLLSSLQNPAVEGPSPGYVKLVDLNGSGHLDLVYTNSAFGTVGVIYGKGNGTFYDPVEYPAGHLAFGIAVAEVNADGALDVVATGDSPSFSGVTVLLNTGGNITKVASSDNPSASGAAVTFTATVTSSKVGGGTAVPTGSVTFLDGTTKLGSGTLNSGGEASFKTSSLSNGSHNIVAQYGGDVNFVATSGQLSQFVGPPDYKLAANPTSQTVNPGSPASYTITLTPLGGYDGTVTINCPSSLPSGVTCNTPLTIAPGKTQATLTVTTTAPTTSMVAPRDVNPHQGGGSLWASLSGLGIVGMVLAGDWKKRNRRRLAIVLTVVALAMILALVGCGGGSSSSSPPPPSGGTPAGTYSIQLTATGTAGTNGGNTGAHTLTVTLVVK